MYCGGGNGTRKWSRRSAGCAVGSTKDVVECLSGEGAASVSSSVVGRSGGSVISVVGRHRARRSFFEVAGADGQWS